MVSRAGGSGGAPALAGLVARRVVPGRVLLDVHLANLLAADVADEHEPDRTKVTRQLAHAGIKGVVIAVTDHLVFSHGKSQPSSDAPAGGRMVEIGSDGWPSTPS